MNDAPRSLSERYSAALERHLAMPDEAALLYAHELGRSALADGLGVLDVALVHHEALSAVTANTPSADKTAKLDQAAEFFIESLSPFEMSLRGYRESNADLVMLNETLLQAKIAAETANRELESFSYSVAHDLRAPLRSIDGFSQALLEDYADALDDEGRKYLEYVRESAQQMAQLIDDLLNLSRVTRSEFHQEATDLSLIARGVAAELRRMEPDRSVDVTVANGLVAEGDERLLKIALENLIGNAWKFTGKRPDARIEFGAAAGDGRVVYFIRDNGAGFDMAYADKLFGVFQRLHAAHEFEGTGIGLATVQRIVRRHAGHIWAEGEVDRGATFFFTLGGSPSNEGQS